MMPLDAITNLSDDILVKVNRAAMSVSLKARVHMVDHRIFKFACRQPLRMKVRDGKGKWVLRQLLHRHVRQHLVGRPKMGLAVPLDAWLRGPLREWDGYLLAKPCRRIESFLDVRLLRRRWQEHRAGGRNWQYQLRNVLIFEAWLEAGRCES
jgi:asparagine synthase (glutamine-hydrolysing)